MVVWQGVQLIGSAALQKWNSEGRSCICETVKHGYFIGPSF